MDSHRQDDHLSTSDGECEGEETQMTDDDETQMSENDMTPNKNVESQIFPSFRARKCKSIESYSEQQMDENSQHLGNLSPSSQECDTDSDNTDFFQEPVAKRRRSHEHLSTSDSNGAESGDDYMSKASGSKSADITESQRSQRQRARIFKQQSITDTFHKTQKKTEEIKKNKAKGQPPSPIKKRKEQKNVSWVWKLAKKIKKEGTTYVKCNICDHDIGKHISGTSNVIRHIKNNHKPEYKKATGKSIDTEEQQQPKIDTQFGKTITWKRQSKKSVHWDRKILRFICETGQALSTIEKKSFRDLLHPEYQPPNRKTFTRNIVHNGYIRTRNAVQEIILSNPNKFIGLQVDHSTAGNYDTFGSFCIQFVDQNFELHSVSTGTFPYTGRHTAEALYESIEGDQGLVQVWNLQRFKRVYTTDSYSGNKAGFSNKTDIYWVPCLAHQFHNTVKAGLEKCPPMNKLHGKMKKILEFCHKSPMHLKLIKGNAKWLGLPELTVKTECPTRWNSFMLCCERFILIKDPLNITLTNAGRTDLVLTPGDTLLMNQIVGELTSFRDLTVMLSSNTKYTFNEYFPMVEGIRRQLRKKRQPNELSHETVDFIKKMKEHFDNFVLQEPVKKLALVASLLDPKNINNFPSTYVTTFVDSVVELLSDIAPPESQDIVGPSQPHVNVSVNIKKSDRSKGKANPLSIYFDPTKGWAAPELPAEEEVYRPEIKDVRETVLIEVSNMRHQILNNRVSLMEQINDGTYDCATWWKNNHIQYPTLAIVAKNLFCIPATSASCERAFSTLTDVVTKKRNRLHAETTQKLTFLKHNLQYMPTYTTYYEEETATQTENDEDLENYDLDQWE